MLFRNDLSRLWPLMSAEGDPPAAGGGATPPVTSAPASPPAPAPTPSAAPTATPPAAPAAPAEPAKGGTILGSGGQPEPPKGPDGTPPAPDAGALRAEDLKVPEGFSIGEDNVKALVETLNKPDLTPQARGQALLDQHLKIVKEVAEQPHRAWDDLNSQWKKEIATDKDIGTGDEKAPLKPAVLASVAKVLDTYGTPELRTALDVTGAGNHPAMVRFMAKIGQLLNEGSFVPGNAAGAGAKTPAQAMYPDLPSSDARG